MKIKPVFLFIVALSTSLFATTITAHKTRPSSEQIKKDMDAKNYAPYSHDGFDVIDSRTLVERGIIQSEGLLENNTSVHSTASVIAAFDCNIGTNSKWSSTIYGFDFEGGSVTCLVAPAGDIYNPLGIFTIKYPKIKEYFAKDFKKAKSEQSYLIDLAKDRFSLIKHEKQAIKDSVIGSTYTHLTIPQLVLATILVDDSIIDVTSTKDTQKIQLKNGLSSSILSNGKETDNKDYILNDLESVFINYAKLSNLSMQYLIYLLGFFALYGLGSAGLHYYKTREKASGMYIGGLLAGLLFFVPFSQTDNVVNGTDTYETKYQDFERTGYKLFMNWGDEMSSLLIDTQIDSIISKSGVGTASQIINSAAGKLKYTKLNDVVSKLNQDICLGYYDQNFMLKIGNGVSDNSSTVFPTSEIWAYAMGLYKGNNDYYSLVTRSAAYSSDVTSAWNQYKSQAVNGTANISASYYPDISLAACGKNYFKIASTKKKLKLYSNLYNSVTSNDPQADNKIEMIRNLVKFQYSLQRDWGMLGILGLPITKLQTEMIGSLYQKNTDVLDKLNDKISADNGLLHSLFSSIPYMFVPGAGTVFDTTLSTIRDLKKGYEQSLPGWLGGKLGANIVASGAANAAGFSLSYLTAKAVLEILPIVGIIAIGILRFIVIIIKIFTLHFSMLFMLPLAFVKNNVQILGKFTIKVLSVMFELPIFVLATYLAIVANDLVHNIGQLFTKTMVSGMIENSNAQHVADTFDWESLTSTNFQITDTIKIYLIDGFFEVLIALFSVFIIYKIMISLHSMIFEQFEMQGTKAMEGAIDSIKQDAANMGGKI